jgi:hypothetical protein
MAAIVGSEEVHVDWLVTSPVPPFPNVPVAENCCVLPGWMLVFAGLAVSPTTSFEPLKNCPQQPVNNEAIKMAATNRM